MSKRNVPRGMSCLVCGQALPPFQSRGRRQLYCSTRCMMAGQRRQQALQGKVSGYYAQRPSWSGAGGGPAPNKGQTGHAHGTITNKPRDLESDDTGVA